MRSPCRGELVVPREQRIGVIRHIQHRKVTREEAPREDSERDCEEERVRYGRGARKVDPAPDFQKCARKRQHALHEADDERQHESEVSEFWYHETFSVSLLPVLLN